jgi:hypothetical protein
VGRFLGRCRRARRPSHNSIRARWSAAPETGQRTPHNPRLTSPRPAATAP